MTDHSAYYRLAKAVRLLEEDAADDMIERHSGQLELIPDGAVMVEEVQKRRGGRPKRFAMPTPKGIQALREVRETMLSLWAGIEDRLENV